MRFSICKDDQVGVWRSTLARQGGMTVAALKEGLAHKDSTGPTKVYLNSRFLYYSEATGLGLSQKSNNSHVEAQYLVTMVQH